MEKGFTKIFGQAVLVGLLTGCIVIAFRLGIESLFSFVMSHFYSNPIIFLPVTTLGGLLAGIIIQKFAPETSGSGIPYVKMSLLKSGRLIRVRTVFVKFIAGILGIGTGLSLGREGPSVQLGAGVGSFVGKISKLSGNNRDKLIAAGAGAAIGATFNAPIAGTMFVLEELIHKFSPSMLFPTLIATAVSAEVARFFLGTNPSFNVSLPQITVEGSLLPVCIILGLISGYVGIMFSKTIFLFNNIYSKINIPNSFKPAIAGFLTGLIGLALPYILSSGNGSVEMLMKGEFPIGIICIIFIVKFFVTPVCFGSGAAGGIFLPMLMLGSFLGYITGFCANLVGADVNIAVISSIGMAGFLASVARTPITAVVMVFEMTGGYECILPLMLTAAIADMVAEKLNHKPIYAKLVVNQYKNANINLSETTLVKDVMTVDVKCFNDSTCILEILNTMNTEGHNAYPIQNKKGRLCGIITRSDIEDVIIDNKMKSIPVSRILETNPVTVYPNDNLYTAYYRLHENGTEWAIVTDKSLKVIGIITRKDVLSA